MDYERGVPRIARIRDRLGAHPLGDGKRVRGRDANALRVPRLTASRAAPSHAVVTVGGDGVVDGVTERTTDGCSRRSGT